MAAQFVVFVNKAYQKMSKRKQFGIKIAAAICLASNAARLTDFDTDKPIILTTDASSFGIGSCLRYKVTDNNARVRLQPLTYASASL